MKYKLSHDLKEFDKFKRDLSNRWRVVSVYDIEGIEDLNFDGFKPYIFSLMNKNRDVIAYIDRFFKKAKDFYLIYKITEGVKVTEEKPIGNLKKFIKGQF